MIHLLWASLALPIIVHLIYRRTAERVPFSTLYFLRRLDRRVARRERLKKWLLLLLRMLLLACIIGALEKPIIWSAGSGQSDLPTTAIIVLDNTASMRASNQGTSSFQNAKEAALQVIDNLESEDSASIVTFQPDTVSETTPSTNITSLRAKLEDMKCGHGSGAVAGALDRARKAVDASTKPRKVTYVISDMQKASWDEIPDPEKLENWPENVPVHLLNVAKDVETNLSLVDVNLGGRVCVAGTATPVFCAVHNTGDSAASSRLDLHINGNKVDSMDITVPADSRKRISFAPTFDEPGWHQGRITLEGDALGADNRRYFALKALEEIPVLLVTGSIQANRYQQPGFYLRLALNAGRNRGSAESPLSTDVIRPSELANHALDRYACVVIAGLKRVRAGWGTLLRNYVQRGGGVLLFCGPRLDKATINREFRNSDGQGVPLLPAALGETVTIGKDEGPRTVSSINRQHPALRPLGDDIAFDGVQVKGFHQMRLSADAGGTPLLSLDGGPLLVENRRESGAFLVFTTGAGTEWSNLPLQPSFLPLIHQLIYYTGRMENEQFSIEVGAPYSIRTVNARGGIEVEVLRPPAEGDEPIRDSLKGSNDNKKQVIYRRTEQPGVYRISYRADGAEQHERFAVNIPAPEGELQFVSTEEVQSKLKNINTTVLDEPADGVTALRRGRQGWPLWDVLLLAAVVLGLSEAWVANVWMKR